MTLITGYRFWYRKVFLKDIFTPLLWFWGFPEQRLWIMFLSTEPDSGYISHSPESNTVQRLAFYFFSSWIHEEQSLWSPEQRNTFCTRKKLFCLQVCLQTNNKKQTGNPTPRLPVTGAISLCSLFIILQGKTLVVREEYSLFMKTNLFMKALISFYEVLNDTKAVWWSLWDRLFKLTDWWADYWGVWNILPTQMIFNDFSQSG